MGSWSEHDDNQGICVGELLEGQLIIIETRIEQNKGDLPCTGTDVGI